MGSLELFGASIVFLLVGIYIGARRGFQKINRQLKKNEECLKAMDKGTDFKRKHRPNDDYFAAQAKDRKALRRIKEL